MPVCYLKKEIQTCRNCEYKSRCDIYWYVMDLTAERNICPRDQMMESCPKTGRRIPGKCELTEGDNIE